MLINIVQLEISNYFIHFQKQIFKIFFQVVQIKQIINVLFVKNGGVRMNFFRILSRYVEIKLFKDKKNVKMEIKYLMMAVLNVNFHVRIFANLVNLEFAPNVKLDLFLIQIILAFLYVETVFQYHIQMKNVRLKVIKMNAKTVDLLQFLIAKLFIFQIVQNVTKDFLIYNLYDILIVEII
ncbi:unnamed protein product [Paramecium pentaurelia]|uniref:Transmembrane protein n=1 Tax=Paramecium pentaurelia TaxID=43138 RepID=A0A8S1Y5Y0_9CILI|nr:unnamed protein product [Paramecium pentaurelia]